MQMILRGYFRCDFFLMTARLTVVWTVLGGLRQGVDGQRRTYESAPYSRCHSPTSMSRIVSPSTTMRTAVRTLWKP